MREFFTITALLVIALVLAHLRATVWETLIVLFCLLVIGRNINYNTDKYDY